MAAVPVPPDWPPAGCAIRSGDLKLIWGSPGDARRLRWPSLGATASQFGASGGSRRKEGAQCLAGIVADGIKDNSWGCQHGCLFNISSDKSETFDISQQPGMHKHVEKMKARLKQVGSAAPVQNSYYGKKQENEAMESICAAEINTGYLEPANVL